MTSVNIPTSVTSIEDSAFRGCSVLNSVLIPNSVTTIKNNAFTECEGLKKLTFIDGIDNLDMICTFRNSPIEELYLGRNMTYSGSGDTPFYYNTTFKIISIGKFVTTTKIYPSRSEELEVINCYSEKPPTINSFTNNKP